jgi:hypothetical protein
LIKIWFITTHRSFLFSHSLFRTSLLNHSFITPKNITVLMF